MNILEEASSLISGDRSRDYGTATENFGRIARYWSEWLSKKLRTPLDARDIGVLMVLLKIAREQNTPKRDNLVDACGYLGCLEQIDVEAARSASQMVKMKDFLQKWDEVNTLPADVKPDAKPDCAAERHCGGEYCPVCGPPMVGGTR